MESHFENMIMQSDNPNYFNVDGSDLSSPQTPTDTAGNRGSSFFIFRKRTSSSNKTSSTLKANYNNSNNIDLGKRRGSLKNLLRSRSSSTSINYSQDKINFINRSLNISDSLTPTNSHHTLNARTRTGSFTESNLFAAEDADDVFYAQSNDSKNKFYSLSHNLSQQVESAANARRHSFGNFPSKDQMMTTSFSDEVPKTQAPKAPSTSKDRLGKLNNRHIPDSSAGQINASCSSNMANMDDILMITAKQSESGILWVNYLKACLDRITKQRGKIPFNFLHIKIDDEKITSQLIQRCQTTKLQIVIICPSLLQHPPGFLMQQLSPLLKPERVLGVLLDVTEVRVYEVQKEAFPSFKQWRRCVVRNHDQSFVSDLLGIATDILGRALRVRPVLNSDVTTPTTSHPLAQQTTVAGKNHENFTVIPRKMRIGQNKATVMFTEPLNKDDWIKIKIEKIGHTIEIANIKRRNPYTIHFTVPESCMEISMMIGVRVIKNNVDLGVRPIKCESRLRELEQILKSQDAPMEFMCQSIGITSSDRDKLDLYLVQSFQKNIPPNFHLLSSDVECASGLRLHREASPEEYPTLLHFGARWGLERLCLLLLECPGGDVACEIRNISGKNPAEIAEFFGHFKLCGSIRNFSKINEFTTMYHYFKGISEQSPEKTVIELKSGTSKEEATELAAPEESTEKIPIEGYMEMNGSTSEDTSDSNNNEISKATAISNLNYLNLSKENSASDSMDVVDAVEMKDLKKKDIISSLNELTIKDQEPVTTDEVTSNELKITEEKYYESNELNKVDDTFSDECSNVLENCPAIEVDVNEPNKAPLAVPETEPSMESDYLIQPSNRPVTIFADYLQYPSNKPVEDLQQHDYMNQSIDTMSTMSTSQMSQASSTRKEFEPSHLKLYFKKRPDHEHVAEYAKILDLPSPTRSSRSRHGTLKRHDSDISKKSVDDELLEIINDFKNNVLTIQEVEHLVTNWKNRNDVKKSFQDKQEQLQKMREEYERIQQKMNEHLKRPSPFERMKRLFSRKHSKDESQKSAISVDVLNDSMIQSDRPISTLSLHSNSSSSSGRMSTSSQVSVGDSGTHSDQDEKRQQNNFLYRPGNLMDNYLIPPAPRPVSTPLSTPVDEKHSPYFPLSQGCSADHYVMFPSNIPIHSPCLSSSSSNECSNFPLLTDYSNFSVLNTIDENIEAPHPGFHVQSIKIQKKEIIYSEIQKLDNSCSSFKPKNNNGNQSGNEQESGTNQIPNYMNYTAN